MNQDHLRLIEKFDQKCIENHLSYFIIGGYASTYWGQSRTTLDVDYVVKKTDFDLVKNVMDQLEYELLFVHPKMSYSHFKTKVGLGVRVDFMMVDDGTWSHLEKDSQSANFGEGKPYPIIGPIHLISMKLHSASQPDRQEAFKDLNDILGICIAQNIALSELEDKGILTKYGNERSITRLRDLFSDRGRG